MRRPGASASHRSNSLPAELPRHQSAPAGDKLPPRGSEPFDGSPEFVRTQRSHAARIQLLSAARGFPNAFRTGVLMTVRWKGIQKPGGQCAALDLRQIRNRLLSLSD